MQTIGWMALAVVGLGAPVPAQPPQVFTGHAEAVLALAFSPDENLIATGDGAGKIRLWNLNTGELRMTLSGHARGATTIAFSPDGKALASGGYDKKVMLWDLTTGKPRCVLTGYQSWVRAVCFSPDGTLLASAGDDSTVRLWDVQAQKEQFTLRGHKLTVESIAFSPDGHTLASASRDMTVRLWDVAQGKETSCLQHQSLVYALAFRPDGKVLMTGTGPDLSPLKKLAGATLDDVRKAIEEPGEVRYWDLGIGKDELSFKIQKGHVSTLTFAPGGKLLAVGSAEYYPRNDRAGAIWLLHATTGRSIASAEKHTGAITCLAFSPSGKWLASASNDKTARLWRVEELLGRDRDK